MQSNFNQNIISHGSGGNAPSTIHGNQPHVFSIGDNSSMVMYNNTGPQKNLGTCVKTDNSMSYHP
jgi:hypothetical protein